MKPRVRGWGSCQVPEERRSAPWDGDAGRRTASQTEMVKPEASQTVMVKPEASQTAVASQTEMVKPEASQTEMVKPEASQTEMVKPEASQTLMDGGGPHREGLVTVVELPR